MSPLRFDMLIIAVIAAGAVIAGVYLFMLAIPRNDDERLHDGISQPGRMKSRFLRGVGGMGMSRGDRNLTDPGRPPNGETTAMIDAEVNEGGPPSLIPCDTPFERTARHKQHTVMGGEPAMIEACPAPDRILHLPIGEAVGAATSTTLMKSAGLELIRLVIPAGKEIPPHRAAGEITVQCIEGHVAFEHDGHAIDLHGGDLLHLCPQESHALKGIVDSSVLVTRLRPHADEQPEKLKSS